MLRIAGRSSQRWESASNGDSTRRHGLQFVSVHVMFITLEDVVSINKALPNVTKSGL
jgi:hypothetical protein